MGSEALTINTKIPRIHRTDEMWARPYGRETMVVSQSWVRPPKKCGSTGTYTTVLAMCEGS